MKFKKINSIILTVVSIFSMSAVPTFAGRTSQHSGSRINQKTSSKIGDKKPSPQRNISKKSHNKICFCISCGCHVQDLKER